MYSISLDNWIDHDPIAKRFPLLHFSETNWVVDITQGLSWSIPDSIPAEVRSFLIQKTELIPLSHSVPDKLSWIGHASGALSLKSAWNTLRSSKEAVVWSGLAWNKIINPRLSYFSWRLLLRKTPTDTLVMHTGQAPQQQAIPEESSVGLPRQNLWYVQVFFWYGYSVSPNSESLRMGRLAFLLLSPWLLPLLLAPAPDREVLCLVLECTRGSLPVFAISLPVRRSGR
ncbi:hypothetical protein AAC387_Pa12g2181 [Persea americana]